jgi:hypothetical protein
MKLLSFWLIDFFDFMGFDFMMFNYTGLGFVAIVIPFIFVAYVLWLNDRKKRYEMELNLSREGEKSLPTFNKQRLNRINLEKGIVYIFMGMGIFLFFWIAGLLTGRLFRTENLYAMSAGIVPFMVGIGYLLVYFLQKSEK